MKILFFLFLLIGKTISQSELYYIPSDEVDFIESYKKFDSLTFFHLKELYERQINVPEGELVLLCEIFPQLYDILPLEKDQLESYIPWDEEKIKKFFEDYPILRSFIPFLKFDYKERTSGTFSFFIKKSYDDTTTKKWGRLNLRREKCKFVGSFNSYDYGVKWQRRLLSVKPEKWLSIESGNVIPFEDRGICYGFFPSYSYSTSFENWLYGGINFWNCLKISVGNKEKSFTPQILYFFHKRTQEKISGCKVTILQKRKFRTFITISRLLIDSGTLQKKDLLYFHGNIRVNIQNIISDFYFCFEEKNKKVIPFSWLNVFKNGGIEHTIHILHIPSNFDAPYSFILNKYIEELEEKLSLFEPLSIVKLSSSAKLFENFYLAPATEFVFNNFNVDNYKLQVKSQILIGRVENKITITYNKYEDRDENTQLTIDNIFSYKSNSIGIEGGYRYYYTFHTHYNKTRLKLAIFSTILKCLQEQLFGKIILEKENIKEAILGITHKVNFSNKTSSELTFEKEIKNTFYEGELRIKANVILSF